MSKKRGRVSLNETSNKRGKHMANSEPVIIISDGEAEEIEELYEKPARGEIEEVKTMVTSDIEGKQFEISTVKLKYFNNIYEQAKLLFHESGIHITTSKFCFVIPFNQLDELIFERNPSTEMNSVFSDIIRIAFYIAPSETENETVLPYYTNFDAMEETKNVSDIESKLKKEKKKTRTRKEKESVSLSAIFDNIIDYNENIAKLNQIIATVNTANNDLVESLHNYLQQTQLIDNIPQPEIFNIDFIHQISATILNLLPTAQNCLRKKINACNINNQSKYIDNNDNVNTQNVVTILDSQEDHQPEPDVDDLINNPPSKRVFLELLSSSAINLEISKLIEQFGFAIAFRSEVFPDESLFEIHKQLSYTEDQSFYSWLSKQNSIQLSPRDIYLLQPEKQLNDNIIDFYMTYIQEEIIPKEKRSEFHFCNCFFHNMIKKKDFDSVQLNKLISPNEFFDKKYIIIPVNESNHWTLIVLYNVRKIVRRKAKLLCFNSLLQQTSNFPRLLRKFLTFCWKHTTYYEQCKSIEFTPLTLQALKLKLPQQLNDYDCGLFILQYAEQFCKAPHIDPDFYTEDWFDAVDMFSKRKKMFDALAALTNLPKSDPIL